MKSVFLLILCAFLVGCQNDPHAHRYMTHEPGIEEVAGEYELDVISMERFEPGIAEKVKALADRPKIQILADGRFLATQFPFFTATGERLEYRFESFRLIKSRWGPATLGAVSDGSGKSETIYGISLKGLPPVMDSAIFTGKKQVDGLIFRFGDPDSGDAILFKKIK